jgi:hypothetical protein
MIEGAITTKRIPPCYDPATVHFTVVYRPVFPFAPVCLCLDQLSCKRYSHADSLRSSKGKNNHSTPGYQYSRYFCTTQGYIAACGCTGESTHYPTAALSQMAFGSSRNYGPGCGRCFKLTLLNSYTATPPFFPDTHPSVVIKVTDLCPLSQDGWCSATENKTNPYVPRSLHRGYFVSVLVPVCQGVVFHGRMRAYWSLQEWPIP